jgi:hypothetical protein
LWVIRLTPVTSKTGCARPLTNCCASKLLRVDARLNEQRQRRRRGEHECSTLLHRRLLRLRESCAKRGRVSIAATQESNPFF